MACRGRSEILLNHQALESIAAERFKVAPVTPSERVSALFRNEFHSFWESQSLQQSNHFLPMRAHGCCLYVIKLAVKVVPQFSSNLVAKAAIRLAAFLEPLFRDALWIPLNFDVTGGEIRSMVLT